jgi:hypothetical protein
MTRTYHQHASGEFSVDVIAGMKHYGLNDKRGQFRYQVDIDYTFGALDSNNFLLDNTDFQRYFQTLPPVSVSCERLAEMSADHFLSDLADRAENVKRVSVRIYPFGDVYVESEITLEAISDVSHDWTVAHAGELFNELSREHNGFAKGARV